MKKSIFLLSLLMLIAGRAAADQIMVTVGTNGAGAAVVTGAGPLQNDDTTIVENEDHRLRVECTPVAACTGLTVSFRGQEICAAQSGVCGADIAAADLQSPAALLIVSQGRVIFQTTLATDVEQEGDAQTLSVSEIVRNNPCPPDISSARYDRRNDKAVFVTDVLGNAVIPAERVDEDDEIRVVVYGDTRLLPLLTVRRKSAIRTVGALRIVGQNLTISLPGADGAQAAVRGQCSQREFVLQDFAPGKGEIEIFITAEEGPQSIGTFDFLVHALYDGMFSFGLASSSVSDMTFKLRTEGDKKFIYAAEEGDSRQYAVLYTKFLRKRDIEKKPLDWYERINPTVGLSVENSTENAYAGLSYDFGGFVITVGQHFARVTALSSDAGLALGDEFVGAENEIPTATRWENDTFVGLSFDLRAAADLLKTLTGAGGGGE